MNIKEKDKKILDDAVITLEETFNCKLSLHDYSGQLHQAFPDLSYYHLNPFCTTIKYKLPRSTPACIAFDRGSVQKRLAINAAPFLKYCRFGLLETVIPVFIENKLSGSIFIGPFIPHSKTLSPDILKAINKPLNNPALEKQRAALPQLTPKIRKAVFAWGLLISAHIENLIKFSSDSVYADSSSRAEKIKAFIDARFKENISLKDLAKALLLCESRISQLLREYFNQSFPELLTEKRMQHARSLLKNSMFSIELIANNCGYSDPAYFHRVFKKHNNLTPKQFRQQFKDKTC
jgi:AraC-like DNA-binding protein